MKKGWTYKKIKDVGEVIGGTTPSTTNPEFWGGDICWISPAELHGEHYLYDSVKKITAKAVSAKSLKELPVGTVILSSRAPIGKIAINKVPMYCNQGFKCVVCGPELYNEFLYWWFYGKVDYLNSLGTGATFKEISKTVVENIVVPIAPIKEQKRIVERLDAAFAQIDDLKAYAEKQLAEARALFQKALAKAMEPKEGWEEKKLKEITSSIGDGLHGTPKYSDEGKYYFVNGNNFEDGIIDIKENTKRVDSDEYDKYKIHLDETTVLLSINGTIGKTAFYNGEPIILGKSACYINVLPSLSKEYLRYFLLSDNFIEYAKHNSRQATIVNLGLKEIRTMPISFPPLSEQQRIVKRLDSISENVRKYEDIQQKIITECDALKQALLRQVFE